MIRILIIVHAFLLGCNGEGKVASVPNISENHIAEPQSNRIEQRIPPETHFTRVELDTSSFAFYLRNLPLKPTQSKVKLFDGRIKHNNNVYCAVVDLPIGSKDLHQCADAIIRLRAEYLWGQGRFEEIEFKLTNGFDVPYSRWMKGDRVKVKGNTTKWTSGASPSNSYDGFWNYLEFIFTYAGTASLSKELESKPISNAQVGDILIQGGFPGHAVIILDAIVDKLGHRKYLLGQSYMPAQEIQVLLNPSNELSPWYMFSEVAQVVTPEWTFEPSDIKSFVNKAIFEE